MPFKKGLFCDVTDVLGVQEICILDNLKTSLSSNLHRKRMFLVFCKQRGIQLFFMNFLQVITGVNEPNLYDKSFLIKTFKIGSAR